MIFAFSGEDAHALDELIDIDSSVKKQRLPVVLTDEMLENAKGKEVSITMMNGHILKGTLDEYNTYNFTINIHQKLVLAYRHATHQLEI